LKLVLVVFSSELPPSGKIAEKSRHCRLKSLGEHNNRIQRNTDFTALDFPDLGPMRSAEHR
jgi:hypothetical protein